MKYFGIDLFSGSGGLTEGMKKAGFKTIMAIENNKNAVDCYKMNHKRINVIHKDIRKVDIEECKNILKDRTLHLLAGCPPCQGFSSVRRLNRKESVNDDRNNLITEYFRFIKELAPLTFMMENVPAVKNYYLFKGMVKKLKKLGYYTDCEVVDIQYYGIPQRRKRLIIVGSKLEKIKIAQGKYKKRTVKDTIKDIDPPEESEDPLHKIYPIHTEKIRKMIERIPLDGGSRTDLPLEAQLECHKKPNVGFKDIYGRLSWDDVSSTITGGCLNPSKGRFLHPEKNRNITAREAALLQTFPRNYKFPLNIPRSELGLLIGNALPPEFSKIQCLNIKRHLDDYYNV